MNKPLAVCLRICGMNHCFTPAQAASDHLPDESMDVLATNGVTGRFPPFPAKYRRAP